MMAKKVAFFQKQYFLLGKFWDPCENRGIKIMTNEAKIHGSLPFMQRLIGEHELKRNRHRRKNDL